MHTQIHDFDEAKEVVLQPQVMWWPTTAVILHVWVTSCPQDLVVDVIDDKVEVREAKLITDHILISNEIRSPVRSPLSKMTFQYLLFVTSVCEVSHRSH